MGDPKGEVEKAKRLVAALESKNKTERTAAAVKILDMVGFKERKHSG